MRQKLRDIGGARVHIHGDHGYQHQDRANEGIEEKLKRGVDTLLAAPDTDDQEHRDQTCFEEQIEQDQIQRTEDADHQRFQHEEGDHVFLDAVLHVPARGDGQRHQEGGQHHEQDRDPVDTHLVLQPHQPFALFHELEAGVFRIKLRNQEERHKEGRGGGDQRHPFRVGLRGFIFAPQEKRQHQRRNQRNEGDDGQEVLHYSAPPLIVIHVIRTAMPITMAKA